MSGGGTKLKSRVRHTLGTDILRYPDIRASDFGGYRTQRWEEVSLTCAYLPAFASSSHTPLGIPSGALPPKTSSITYLHLCLSAFRSVSRTIDLGDLQRISCCTEVKKNLCIMVLCSFFFLSCTSRASFVVDPEQQVINICSATGEHADYMYALNVLICVRAELVLVRTAQVGAPRKL